ncbi:unnamed protein product [Scytosiphon promiscuus]
MAGSIPSLARVHDLLRELRLGIRRIEVVEPRTTESSDSSWTRQSIEAFNSSSIRTVAACRDALNEARFEAEQRASESGDSADGGAGSLTKVTQAERDLEHVRMELRRAVTLRKRHEERRCNATSRAALLGTDGSGGTRRRGLSNGEAPGSAAGEAREMKQSLQRTRKMMAEQLARVAQVSEVMGEQDALLMNTFAEHQGIGGSLKRAGTTLTRLKAADMMDTIIMVASTVFFFATVCFVVYQRIPLLGLL